MGPDLWKLIRDCNAGLATHAVFAAAVKHSPLLGDFLDIVVGDQYRMFSKGLTTKLWADYLEGCRERDSDMPLWNENNPQAATVFSVPDACAGRLYRKYS
jgi:bacteriophage exclusion system BrxA-like protein